MLKLVGAILLMASAAGIGLGAASQLRARVSALRALVEGLESLEREMSFRLSSMPELMDCLAKQTQPPAAYLFAYCRDHMEELGEKRFGQIWKEALEENPDLLLEQAEQQILSNVGEVLGRYDAGEQRRALHSASAELEQCLLRAEEERLRLGRVYTALGLGSGAMLVILLF